jgi:hypothetical protein
MPRIAVVVDDDVSIEIIQLGFLAPVFLAAANHLRSAST